MTEKWRGHLGCTFVGDHCEFLVWAPRVKSLEVRMVSPRARIVPMRADDCGYHHAVVERLAPGSRYLYGLDGKLDRPDPASRFQPDGVHGPSEVVDPTFDWGDGSWSGLALKDYVFYELHTGTFTPAGTFDAILPRLSELKDLGITAIEVMPVAQFPGARNWGYDGVCPFAVQNWYGGPAGLKRLVDACHARGLAVVLDVVYNHLGPEGNYLAEFAPYFTDCYHTPWGQAINFDGPDSDQVRRYFIENAWYWITDLHVDALRLDAVHAIVDTSARTFLEELTEAVHERGQQLGRKVHVIAECDRSNARLTWTRDQGGYGLDAQWNDDFHHALHALLTREQNGYYCDFGSLEQMARAFRDGFVYSGQYSVYRRCTHGISSRDLPGCRLVVCAQNHDQVGNRMMGERLSALVSFESLKLAASVLLLSPFLPLLFMGEEYGETAPFQYFVSHADAQLIEAVRKGRREEFAAFEWNTEAPDPLSEETFLRSKLDWRLRSEREHKVLLNLYQELLRLRREVPALACLNKDNLEATTDEEKQTLIVRRWLDTSHIVAAFHFGDEPVEITLPFPAGRWVKQLDSSEECWGGSGSAVPTSLHFPGQAITKMNATSMVLFAKR